MRGVKDNRRLSYLWNKQWATWMLSTTIRFRMSTSHCIPQWVYTRYCNPTLKCTLLNIWTAIITRRSLIWEARTTTRITSGSKHSMQTPKISTRPVPKLNSDSNPNSDWDHWISPIWAKGGLSFRTTTTSLIPKMPRIYIQFALRNWTRKRANKTSPLSISISPQHSQPNSPKLSRITTGYILFLLKDNAI